MTAKTLAHETLRCKRDDEKDAGAASGAPGRLRRRRRCGARFSADAARYLKMVSAMPTFNEGKAHGPVDGGVGAADYLV